jgi:hypothetical protein
MGISGISLNIPREPSQSQEYPLGPSREVKNILRYSPKNLRIPPDTLSGTFTKPRIPLGNFHKVKNILKNISKYSLVNFLKVEKRAGELSQD